MEIHKNVKILKPYFVQTHAANTCPCYLTTQQWWRPRSCYLAVVLVTIPFLRDCMSSLLSNWDNYKRSEPSLRPCILKMARCEGCHETRRPDCQRLVMSLKFNALRSILDLTARSSLRNERFCHLCQWPKRKTRTFGNMRSHILTVDMFADAFFTTSILKKTFSWWQRFCVMSSP